MRFGSKEHTDELRRMSAMANAPRDGEKGPRRIVGYRVRWTSHGGMGESSTSWHTVKQGITIDRCLQLAHESAAEAIEAGGKNVRILRIVRSANGERGRR